MLKDERDVVEVLKSELEFLKTGGYTGGGAWAPRYIFEDSPTCLNFGHRHNPSPCTGCILIDFVPLERRSEKLPCRHIPLDTSGQTLESLYRHSDQEEVEAAVCDWLELAIQHSEQERERHRQETRIPLGNPEARGIPLYEQVQPKCANPACAAAFHWLAGGKFFRFQREELSLNENQRKGNSPTGHQGVKHYWLCEHCLRLFTLMYEPGQGVVLRPRRLGFAMARGSGEAQ